jgi:hypothetical protein
MNARHIPSPSIHQKERKKERQRFIQDKKMRRERNFLPPVKSHVKSPVKLGILKTSITP